MNSKKMRRFFISGTNTDIGKTYFSTLFCDYWLKKGLSVKYIKPVQTGWPESDAAYVVANSGMTENDVATLHTHEKPVAPCLVFDPFPFDAVVQHINDILNVDVLIVESAGGLLVPLDYDHLSCEIPKQCDLETIVVIPNRLGCVNDTLLNYHFIKNHEIPFYGFAMNNYFMASDNDVHNVGMISRLTKNSVICEFANEITNIEFN